MSPCSGSALNDIVEIQTVPGREWMALCGCKAESVVPNYRETISGPVGFRPTPLSVRVRLGLRFSLHVVGALEQSRRNSPDTAAKREGLGFFCNQCLLFEINYPSP